LPSRDPETGQFTGGSGGHSGLRFSDVEIQNIGFRKEGTLGGADGDSASRNDYEITERGLDHNEIAELVFMYRDYYLAAESTGGTGSDATAPGSLEGAASLGVNLEGAEDIVSDQPYVDGPDSVTDERGQLDFVEAEIAVLYQDTANQNGGGGNSMGRDRTMNWRHHFGRGPAFDSADDLSLRMDVEKHGAGGDTRAKSHVYYQLGWVVHEVEDIRPQFGLP
jgi:hypothetical protein